MVNLTWMDPNVVGFELKEAPQLKWQASFLRENFLLLNLIA